MSGKHEHTHKETWKYDDSDHADEYHVVTDALGQPVALACGNFDEGQRRAHLISAAPEMLRALEELVQDARPPGENAIGWYSYELITQIAIVRRVFVLIAKARGEHGKK